MPEKLPPVVTQVTTTFAEENGEIVVLKEHKVQDLDTDDWVVVARDIDPVGMSKSDLLAHLAAAKIRVRDNAAASEANLDKKIADIAKLTGV